MKKGIIVGQLFIYVLALIVFSLIMLFGFNAIRNLMEKGEQTQFVKFKTDLENEIRSISSQYGDVRIFNARNQMRVPGTYKKVCFIDIDTNPTNSKLCNAQLQEYNPIICDSWKTTMQQKQQHIQGPFQNVFLIPQASSPIMIEDKIKIDIDKENTPGYGIPDTIGELCLNVVQGRIDFRLEGRGNFVLISPLQ